MRRLADTRVVVLQGVAAGIPPGGCVLVPADGGLGTSPALLQAMAARGWHCLVRVQGQVRVRLAEGRIRPFTRLVPNPGRRRCGWVEACKKAGWVRCWAAGLWRGPYKEPWLLLTNWHDDTVLVLDNHRIGVAFRTELTDG